MKLQPPVSLYILRLRYTYISLLLPVVFYGRENWSLTLKENSWAKSVLKCDAGEDTWA
jgi:hypothetical protein